MSDDRAMAADRDPSRLCDHICLKDDGHVERGERHFYGYEIPSPRRRLIEVGADYCTVHHGIRNEDMSACDFAYDGAGIPDPESCVLHTLVYVEAASAASRSGGAA